MICGYMPLRVAVGNREEKPDGERLQPKKVKKYKAECDDYRLGTAKQQEVTYSR